MAPAAPALAGLAGVLPLIVPKCPFCLVGYGAALAALGFDLKVTWLVADSISVVALVVSWLVVVILAIRRRDPLTTALVSAGIAVAFAARAFHLAPALHWVGAVVVALAALLNSRRCRTGLRATAACEVTTKGSGKWISTRT